MEGADSFGLLRLAAYGIFGAIGFVAFVYGKKNALWKPIVIGVTLIAYPYSVSQTWAVFAIGIALTASLYIFRR